jgi:hypothetical protein
MQQELSVTVFAEKIIPRIILKGSLNSSIEMSYLTALIDRLHTKDVLEVHVDLSEVEFVNSKGIEMLEKICNKYHKIKISGFANFEDLFQITKAKFYPARCYMGHKGTEQDL